MLGRRVLAGLAVVSILFVAAGTVVSLSAALGRVEAIATGAVLVVATAALVALGVGGTGGLRHTHTPYWR